MHEITGSAIFAGSNNRIVDSNYCTVINGSTNYISGRNNTHIIGDDITANTVNDDDKFFIGCYNGLESSGPIQTDSNLFVDGDMFINGDLNVDGDITAFYNSSDERLKDNIQSITGCLEKILFLDAIEFDWNTDLQNLYSGHDVGLIAQQVQKVAPEIVKERNDGYLAIRYEKLIPLLVGATQEQDDLLIRLEQEVDELINKSSH